MLQSTKKLVCCDRVIAVDRAVRQHIIVQVRNEVLEWGATDKNPYFSSKLSPSVVVTGESSFILFYRRHKRNVGGVRGSIELE